MNSFWLDGLAVLTAKAATIAASFSMAVIAVAIDARRHSWGSAVLAVICGTIMGVIAATSIVSLMGWPDQVGYGIASIFAIAGDRLVKAIMRYADNPLSAWNKWRGKK